MKVKAAAKINLILDVLGTLPDGYHSLFMLMQSVSCYDTVTVERTNSGKIEILTDNPRVPTDEKNIAYKAAAAFLRAHNAKIQAYPSKSRKSFRWRQGLRAAVPMRQAFYSA